MCFKLLFVDNGSKSIVVFRYSLSLSKVKPETPTKRQATQHGCLPRLLDDGDKGIEIVYGEALGRFEQPRQNKNSFRNDKSNEPIKKGPLSFVC
jgi:hypothetical protein